MPKNPFTGEEINEELFEFITQYHHTHAKIMALNSAYVKALPTNPRIYQIEPVRKGGSLTGVMSEFVESFGGFEKTAEEQRNMVEYYEVKQDYDKAADELEALGDNTFDLSDVDRNLIEECENVGVSEEWIDNSVTELLRNEKIWDEACNQSRMIGGPDGIIEHYSLSAMMAANPSKIPMPEQVDAVKKVMEIACGKVFQSEDLTVPGERFMKREAINKRIRSLDNKLSIAKEKAHYLLPESEVEYEEYKQFVSQYDELKDLYEPLKEAYSFPKKTDMMKEDNVMRDALGRYAAVRDKADSHWGITKWLASFLPGIFTETAKDMAREKMWGETLKGAGFTDEDLKNAGKQNVVVEQPVNEAAEKHGTEIEDLDLSPRLSKDIKKNEIEVKVGVKQKESDLNNEKDKNISDLQA